MINRVKYCDMLRSIAIILVILIHVFAGFRDYYLENNYTIYVGLTFFDSLTRVGVPLFFMISGAFMLNNTKQISYNNFIKNKIIIKLVIPFIVISFLYYLCVCIVNKNIISIIEFIKLFTSNGIMYHFWFMYQIILIYFLLPFLKILISKTKKEELLNLIIIIFIFGNVLNTINLYTIRYNYPLFNSFVLPEIIIYINYLLLGYYLFKYSIKTQHIKYFYIIGIICILLLPLADSLYINGVRNDAMLNPKSSFVFIPSIAMFLCFKYNYEKFKISKKLETFISKNASLIFYIYMIHVLVMELVERVIIKFYIPTNFMGSIILLLIIFILTVIISYFVSCVINEIYKSILKLFNKQKGTK